MRRFLRRLCSLGFAPIHVHTQPIVGKNVGKLTTKRVEHLREAGTYGDGDGLMLKVSAGGAQSWLLRVTIHGKRRDIGLGSAKDVSLKEARERTREYRQQIANGLDPLAERRKAEVAVPTFRAAARQVHEEHKLGWKNGKHQAQWLSTLETYAYPLLSDRLVNDIEGPLIRDVLAPIWLTKPETARRVRQRIGAVLDWSYAKGFRATEAPLRSLGRGLPRQPRKQNHFEALPYKEIPQFLARLRDRPTVGRLALELLILTAARSGEVRSMTWDELDLDRALWTVPAERMKMGKLHQVPLSDQALNCLARARRFAMPCTNLVFPGQQPKRPLSDMTLLKILRDLALPVTVHGFRSSFRDWVAEATDYSGEVAEAALAHSVANKVEAAYRRTDFLDKRRGLMIEWGEFCRPLGEPRHG